MMQGYESYFPQGTPQRVNDIWESDFHWQHHIVSQLFDSTAKKPVFWPLQRKPLSADSSGFMKEDFERIIEEARRRQFMDQIVFVSGTRTDLQSIQEHRQAEQADRTFLDTVFIQPPITQRRQLQRVWETTAEQFYHIAVSRGVMNGEPCITGTRIPVSIIVSMVGEGRTFEEIAEDYGNISIEEVREAVLFAARLTSTMAHFSAGFSPV